MLDPSAIPIAHVSHYLWVLYVPPILIVLGSIGLIAAVPITTALAARLVPPEWDESEPSPAHLH